tara:strand:+ start:2182 stop:3345 length:1164 start_codon:yes stop_codon:yes gene_type:complete
VIGNSSKSFNAFIPFSIQLLTVASTFALQLLFLYFMESETELDRQFLQLSVPFFMFGLTGVTLREDLFSSLKKSDMNEIPLSRNIIQIIIINALLVFALMMMQVGEIYIAILGVFFFISMCAISIYSVHIKSVYGDIYPLFLTFVGTFFVITIFLISILLERQIIFLEFYAQAYCVIFLLLVFIFGYPRKLISNSTINFKNLYHNFVFVVPPVIEGFLITFLNPSEYYHLSFVHRIFTTLTGVGVIYVFFYLEKIHSLKEEFIKNMPLIAVGLIFISLAMHLCVLYTHFFDKIFNTFNLEKTLILKISVFFSVAYIFNFLFYVMLRISKGNQFNIKLLLSLIIIFLALNSFGIMFFDNIIYYAFSFSLSWLIFFSVSFIKFRAKGLS